METLWRMRLGNGSMPKGALGFRALVFVLSIIATTLILSMRRSICRSLPIESGIARGAIS
jgi:hypothetical protein